MYCARAARVMQLCCPCSSRACVQGVSGVASVRSCNHVLQPHTHTAACACVADTPRRHCRNCCVAMLLCSGHHPVVQGWQRGGGVSGRAHIWCGGSAAARRAASARHRQRCSCWLGVWCVVQEGGSQGRAGPA
jgi:hypothetical protein